MATIFLIRHGLTAVTGSKLYGRTPGFQLDERGRAQAERLVARFGAVRLTAIYSSPLERCMETVKPLAAATRLPIVTREALIEMDAGTWTGRSLASLRRTKLWREVQLSPSTFRFPGGEAFSDARDRIVTEVERIARRHGRGRVAIATHGDLARIALAHFSGIPFDAFQRTVVDTASVSVVQLSSGRPRVLLVNDTGDGLERFGTGGPTHPWEASAHVDGRSRTHGNLRG
jgi:probable phosphomutase (TIGR03848 family)